MIVINKRNADKTLKEFRETLSGRELAQGTSKAINQSLRELQVQAKKHIASMYNIPAKYLQSIQVNQSNAHKLQGNISSDSVPLPLSLFSPTYQYGFGVSFEVLKGKRSKIGYAFMFKGLRHVLGRGYYLSSKPFGFIRKKGKKAGKDNGSINKDPRKVNRKYYYYPLTRLVTVSVSGALKNALHEPTVKTYVDTVFPDVLFTELKRRVAKIKGGNVRK